MNAALPFFVLSAVALILWIAPGGRMLMTVKEMGTVMEIEGFVLIASFVLTAGVSSLGRMGRKPAAGDSGLMLPIAVLATLVLGGFAALIGGFKLFLTYILMQLAHLVGAFRMSYDDLRIEFPVNMLALFTFAVLGVLAVKMPFLPTFGNSYPVVFDSRIRWNFDLGGHQMLAWACAHFALLGYFHLKKKRMFAHVLEQDL